MIRTQTRIAFALVFLLALSACAKFVPLPGEPPRKTDLQVIADAFEKTAVAISIVQETATTANTSTPQLLTNANHRTVMDITLRVSLAQKEAIQATRDLAKLSDAKKAELLAVVTPVLTALGDALNNNEILTIRDAKTRDTIRASLLAAQMSLSLVQVVITTR